MESSKASRHKGFRAWRCSPRSHQDNRRIFKPCKQAVLSQNKYILVRDFHFAQIFIDNANRLEVLSSMTMDELHGMRMEGDGCVISVIKHKTVHIHGPAYIVLSQKLKACLTLFVQAMLPKVTASTSGPVFFFKKSHNPLENDVNVISKCCRHQCT